MRKGAKVLLATVMLLTVYARTASELWDRVSKIA